MVARLGRRPRRRHDDGVVSRGLRWRRRARRDAETDRDVYGRSRARSYALGRGCMKVVILCGGMGTRLREYTESIPKPMVRVGGVPIIVHIMQMYAAAGMNEFILCLGYLGNAIRDYFLNYEAYNRDFTIQLGKPGSVEYHEGPEHAPSWKVTLVETGAQTMTGARLARAAKYLTPGETFAVTYGDGVADVPLKDVLAFHRAKKRLATLTGVRPPSRFGEIEHDTGIVKSFNEKPQVGTG